MSDMSKQTVAAPVELSEKDLESVQGGYPYYFTYGKKKQAVSLLQGDQSAKGNGSGTTIEDQSVVRAVSQARSSTVG